MLDTILSGLKGSVTEDLISKVGLSPDMLDDVMSITGQVATKEVSKNMLSGAASTVMNLFSDKANNDDANGLQDNITTGIVSGLVSKLGIDSSMANQITAVVVPALMSMISSKNSETADDDASPITKIFGMVGGDSKGGIGDVLGGFFK